MSFNYIKNLTDNNYPEYLKNHGWNHESVFFDERFIDGDTGIHMENDIVYAMSYIFYRQDFVYLYVLEVNEDHRGKGHGSKALKDIARIALKNDIKELRLTSIEAQTDNFYLKNGFNRLDKPGEFVAYENDLKKMIE